MNDVRHAETVLRRVAGAFFGACVGSLGAALIVVVVHFAEK